MTPNRATTPRLDLLNPKDEMLDFFESTDKFKRKKCRKNCMKCSTIFLLLSGMNALSFYVGYIYSERNNDGSELF